MIDVTATDGPQETPRPPMRTATLYIRLNKSVGSSVSFDTEINHLSAGFSAQGYVWNTDSAFDFKKCRVTFYRHATGRLLEFDDEYGLDGACGSIQIEPRLKSEWLDDIGQKIAIPPIVVNIPLDDRSYDRTDKLLWACLANGQEASLQLSFSHRDFKCRYPQLDELDLSAESVYPIVRFHLGGKGQNNTTVFVPKHRCDNEAYADLTFTATAVSIQASVWNSVFSIPEIKLTGKLRSRKFDISSDEDTIEIKEYPGYPDEAFPGVVSVVTEESVTYCGVTLYATEEVLTRLASLLAGMSKGDTVIFHVSIIAEGLPLKIGDRKYFDVTWYKPVLMKSYS